MEQNKKKIIIPGTKVSSNNTQLLISSGIPTFDEIIGGGLPVGTVTLIEEDLCSTYSKLILKYFIAEGVVSGHSTFVGSLEMKSSQLVSNLPAVITDETETLLNENLDDDKLTIAWRYKNMPTNPMKNTRKFGHYFDLTKVMDSSYLDQADVTYWNYSERPETLAYTFANPAYHELLETINKKIDNGGFLLKAKPTSRSILRIALQGLGSPIWLPNNTNFDFETVSSQNRDLDAFLFCLRSLVRTAFATVVVTIPSQIINKDSVERCIHSSDIAIQLQSFRGTELEKNSSLTDYQGFFRIVKLAAINSLVAKEIGPTDFAFKLRRKKFTIEELHLPPELQESNEREQDDISNVSCGSSSKHLYEF